MTVYRCILPKWLDMTPRVVEGQFTPEELSALNQKLYNIYYLPNYPSIYHPNTTVDGSHIDTWQWVFVDCDLKDKVYESKEQFVQAIFNSNLLPTKIIDSGNGVHVYWKIVDLDAMSYLRLQKRLLRYFKTDVTMATLYQLMRVPGTVNTKHENHMVNCEEVYVDEGASYTCEQLDKFLPPITVDDENEVQEHYNRTLHPELLKIEVSDKIPLKFSQLVRDNKEVKDIWSGNVADRSVADFRLAHIMFASGFTKEEAASVLINASKALQRSPKHRLSYAMNIIDKIWTYETTEDKDDLNLSYSVRQILDKYGDEIKGTKFPCWSYLDNTAHGFRLGQVIGLVAGSGVGKTAIALNMFSGFVSNNPDYDHFFIPLEQPPNEIADRWKALCGDNTELHDKVHVMSNYDENGGFRHLSLEEIKAYLLKFQEKTKRKIGCVVIDHIGALKQKSLKGDFQGIQDICHQMKGFAIELNILLVMQSQTSRSKAGIGDLELDKDAAYGTVLFESYCDFLCTIWQPLKRCYMEPGCPTVTAIKYCKIRHKKQDQDHIQEDVCYKLFFDPKTGKLRELTQAEDTSFAFFLNKANNKRKQDKRDGVTSYRSIVDGKTDNNNNSSTTTKAS